jgi:hypothetical protein
MRIVNELDLACLNIIVVITQGLPLQVVDGVNSSLDTAHVQSRLFYRFFSFFTLIIDRWLRNGREREVIFRTIPLNLYYP